MKPTTSVSAETIPNCRSARSLAARSFAAIALIGTFAIATPSFAQSGGSESTPAAKAPAAASTLSITDLISHADAYVGKPVTVEGMATWICPHRGCKAQLVNADGASKTALLITQGKRMEKFSQELKGDTLRVVGVLRETRITAADLDEQEKEIKNPSEKNATESEHDHGGSDCADCPSKQKAAAEPVNAEKAAKAKETQLARIAKYRAMLAKSKKGYLSSFTFEGQSWAKSE